MAGYYDRYKEFRSNGSVEIVPFIKMKKSSSDIMILYDRSRMRMDMLSYKYYGDANYGWLILMNNPNLPSLEFNIPDGAVVYIPYPLSDALARYEAGISSYRAENE